MSSVRPKISIEKRTVEIPTPNVEEKVKKPAKINVIKKTIAVPEQVPEPAPVPVPAPEPEPVPSPVPAPVKVTPKPAPVPLPPKADPAPVPASEPPKAVPVPAPVPAPAPIPSPSPPKAIPAPAPADESPSATDQPDQSESEYDLHPQLQLILQYLADTERVNLVEARVIDDIHSSVRELNKKHDLIVGAICGLEKKLAIIGAGASTSATQSAPAPNVAPNAAPSATPVDPPTNEALPVQSERSAPSLHFFEATFVLDLNGQGKQVAQALRTRGFNNCIVLKTQAPASSSAKVHMTYCLRDVLAISEERRYKFVNVITDSIKVHKKIGYIMDYLDNDLRGANWKILQYLCTKHNYGKMDFDWHFYENTNCDISTRLTDESRARSHWKAKGSIREGRVAKGEIVSTTSNDTSAFALNLSDPTFRDMFKAHIEKCTKNDVSFMDGLTAHLSTVIPNLFISGGVGAKMGKSLKWIEDNYEGMT